LEIDALGDAGIPSGQRYSNSGPATERAAWRVIQRHCPDRTESRCREIIKTWVRDRVLYSEEYDDPVDRKPRRGPRVDAAKRPGREV
jgi:hypothetical protein